MFVNGVPFWSEKYFVIYKKLNKNLLNFQKSHFQDILLRLVSFLLYTLTF